MYNMGFRVDDITRALERTSFPYGKALLLLLNGTDEKRTKYDSQDRFRRHSLNTVKYVDCEHLGSISVCAQYKKRAQDEYLLDVAVHDLGQYAGRSIGACF